MRGPAAWVLGAMLGLAPCCTLPRGVLDAPGVDAAHVVDDGGAIDAFSPPIDGAPSDAVVTDAAIPIDAWSDVGPPMCVPTTEACNLYDDDCDGTTDEDTCGCEHREIGGHVYQLCPAAAGFDAWGGCTVLAADDPTGAIGAGYDLVVIDDATENTAIQAWTMFEWVWIGLDDFTRDGVWVWSDGTVDTLHLFGAGEPNGHENENCVVTSNGAWLDLGCFGTERYLCEGVPRTWPLPAGVAETCDGRDEDLDGAIDETACSCPTFVFDHHVYRRCTTTTSWAAAQADCAIGGYTMVVIDTLTESQMVGRAIAGGSWTGLNDQANEDHFVYESAPSDPVSMGHTAQGGHYVHWAGGEPNDAGGTHAENCVWIDGGGNWYDIDCTRMNGYLCERAIAPL